MSSRFGTIYFLLPTLLVLAVLSSGCDTNENQTMPPPNGAPPPHPVDQTPAWSPSGDRIAYHHNALWTPDSVDDVSGLYMLNLETDSTRLLMEGSARSPDWRPDGKRIAFTTGNIYTIRPDGSNLQQVTDHGSAFFPSWSPDGTRLAYDATTLPQPGIWLVDPDGSTRKNLGLGRYPDWSVHGKRLVYEGSPGTSESGPQLWTSDTSATDSTQLSDNAFENNRYPKWSRDGEWIAWSPITENGYEIWIMRSDGSEKQKLADRGRDPAWGPNSERLVFAKPGRESDLTALWTIQRDGSDLRQITTPSRNPLN
jgi:Tol biopolymer transport system component